MSEIIRVSPDTKTVSRLLGSVLLILVCATSASASEWVEFPQFNFDGEFEDPNHWDTGIVPGSVEALADFNVDEAYTVTVREENVISVFDPSSGLSFGRMEVSAGDVTFDFVPASVGVEPSLIFAERVDVFSGSDATTQASFLDGIVVADSLDVGARAIQANVIVNLDNTLWAGEFSVGVTGDPSGSTRLEARNGSRVQAGSSLASFAGSLSIGGDGGQGEALFDASELIVRDPVASGGVVPIGTFEGRGTLTAQNGSTVEIEQSVNVGTFGGTGTLNLSGGSDLDIGVDLSVGIGESFSGPGTGNATFSAEPDDGLDIGDDLTVGRNGGDGSVTINQGSHVRVGDRVSVGIGDGNAGTRGILSVEDGSTLISDGGTVGSDEGTGKATVTGTGSTWDSRGDWLFIGIDPTEVFDGPGSVEVALGGRLIADQVVIGPQGSLIGNGGVIEGDIENNGTFSPGSSAGRMDVDGNVLFGIDSALIVDIGGNLQGVEYDFLDVDGQVSLGGTLTVELIEDFTSGYEPAVGDVFEFLVASAGFSENWDLVSLPSLSGGKDWIFDEPGTLRVVPIPAALPLFGSALTVLGFIGWRRRNS